MFENTPFKSYREIVEGIREKRYGVRLSKGSRVALCEEAYPHNKLVLWLFPLQFLLPLAFIIPYVCVTRQYWGLIAAAVYLLLPFFWSPGPVIGSALTVLGLFGLVWGWPPMAVSLLTPGILNYWGGMIWWNILQYTVLRVVISDRQAFERLWKSGVLALTDQEKIYRYSKLQRP